MLTMTSPISYPHTAPLLIITAFALLWLLSACDLQTNALSEREARIRTRESELVTLFAELIEQKKSLQQHATHATSETHSIDASGAEHDCVCEAQPETTSPHEPVTKADDKIVLGGVEQLHLDPPGLEFSARIDTGAQTSSINALNIVEFERDGKPFVKFNLVHPITGEKIELTRRLRRYVRVKELGNRESLRRPVVRMRVMLGTIDERINFTLENRSRFKHQVLIGRNLLQDLAVVDVSKKYTTLKNDPTETHGTK